MIDPCETLVPAAVVDVGLKYVVLVPLAVLVATVVPPQVVLLF